MYNITKYSGKVSDISYYIPEFKEPLIRTVDNYDDDISSEDFIKRLQEDKKQKESLEKLYNLSNNIHSHHISAPDKESLDKIIKELDENNLLYDKELVLNK